MLPLVTGWLRQAHAGVRTIEAPPIDFVCPWVYDRAPGFQDLLARLARTSEDRNPERYRDDIDALRYSLRALDVHAPWIRRVHLLLFDETHVPPWLRVDAPRLNLVYHADVLEARHRPTFNSNCLFMAAHRIPGLARHFLLASDDLLMAAPVMPHHLLGDDGRAWLRLALYVAPSAELRDREDVSPYAGSLSRTTHLLNERFGPARWRPPQHCPAMVTVDLWKQLLEEWPDETEATFRHTFRSHRDVEANYLYHHFALQTGAARAAGWSARKLDTRFCPLNSDLRFLRRQLTFVRWSRPLFHCMNDEMEENPSRDVLETTRAFLQEMYPEPSSFELAAPAG